jgi:hypothetical protein
MNEDRIRSARGHVELGRSILNYHKEPFEKHRAEGRDTKPLEDLIEELRTHSESI